MSNVTELTAHEKDMSRYGSASIIHATFCMAQERLDQSACIVGASAAVIDAIYATLVILVRLDGRLYSSQTSTTPANYSTSKQ